MKAHQIRNRTNTFRAILNLQTDRRWCVTGTYVHNSLDDLFTLTEFLRFHPVENRQNVRRWVLDPLGNREDHAIENLRLLMRTVALRRPRESQMKHLRSEVEVAVSLSPSERQQYDSIHTKARNMIVGAEKTTSAHKLLSYILRMRQLCSHGLNGQASRPGPAAGGGSLPCNAVCSKCSDVLPRDQSLNSNSAADGEPKYCLECATEESSTPCLITDPLSFQGGPCWDTSTPEFWTGVAVAPVPDDDDGGDMDLNASTVSTLEWSSKIDSVVNNLLQLEIIRHPDSIPIKR